MIELEPEVGVLFWHCTHETFHEYASLLLGESITAGAQAPSRTSGKQCMSQSTCDAVLLCNRDIPQGDVMDQKLDTGDQFPSMHLNFVDGNSMDIPGDLSARYTIVLFYRGHW